MKVAVNVKVPVRGASSSCVVIWGRSWRITESTAKFCSQIRSIWSNVTNQGVTDNPLRPVAMEIRGYSTLQIMFGNILQDTATQIPILLLLDVTIAVTVILPSKTWSWINIPVPKCSPYPIPTPKPNPTHYFSLKSEGNDR